MDILVSVIIPCYNHGIYLTEAIESIPFTKIDYGIELIVVNDGSTDTFTLDKFKEIEQSGYKVIHQENQGLAASRNNGIRASSGEYIIPLDADNKLHINYLTKAVDILHTNPGIDVVYGDAMYFGNENRLWKSRKFIPAKFVHGNFIDACAIFRKNIWEKVGGYDCHMETPGQEDWEFWTNVFIHGGKFYNLEELCFYYRLRNDAMHVNISSENYEANRIYIIKKHADFFANYFYNNYSTLNYIKQNKIKAAVNLLLGKIKFH